MTDSCKTESPLENNIMSGRSLMEREDTVLMILDVQEKLMQAIPLRENIVWNIQKLVKAANLLNIECIITEQNPKKLGSTIAKLKSLLKVDAIQKMSFSCVSCKEVFSILNTRSINNIVLCGVETHICIQQSAIELINNGLKPFIPIDAVGSRRDQDHNTSLKQLQFEGASITSSESVIFEWCKSSERKEFKQIIELIKMSTR